jgi:hypothetical protein
MADDVLRTRRMHREELSALCILRVLCVSAVNLLAFPTSLR